MIAGAMVFTCPVTQVSLRLVPDYLSPAGQFEERGRGTQTHAARPRQRIGKAPSVGEQL